jgi:hypothetical protein
VRCPAATAGGSPAAERDDLRVEVAGFILVEVRADQLRFGGSPSVARWHNLAAAVVIARQVMQHDPLVAQRGLL